jgi:UDP:flavonoid glycosyltransferase YjiC (YdhE family)
LLLDDPSYRAAALKVSEVVRSERGAVVAVDEIEGVLNGTDFRSL